MKMKKTAVLLIMTCFLAAFAGCGSGNKMENGYYTAEMSDFSHGWKEYVCIYVKNDKIVSAEFNAKDPSGFIKAWDNEYMRNMQSVTGNYPNKYTRGYVQQLIDGQKDTEVDTLSGATHSGGNFAKLIDAAIGQAQKGDFSAAIVPAGAE